MNGFRSLDPISALIVDSAVENTPRKGKIVNYSAHTVQSGTGSETWDGQRPVVFRQHRPKEARINNGSLAAVADDSNARDNSPSL
jgi:hypothetical protein